MMGRRATRGLTNRVDVRGRQKPGATLDVYEHRARNLWHSGGRVRARGHCDISSSVLAERAIAAAANRGDTEGGFIGPAGAGSARVCRFAEIRSYRPGHATAGAAALAAGATMALPAARVAADPAVPATLPAHAEPVDVCARYGGHRVNFMRGHHAMWRCDYPRHR